MKRIAVVCMLCLGLLALAATALAASPPAPDSAVEMKFPGENNKYAPIMFEHHAAHLAVEGSCATCHHMWDGKSAITGCRVEGCHADTSKENKREPTSYDSAFHARNAANSCVGCHTATLKANPEAKSPKKCNDCHSKKS
jgi:hypothetical protein